MNDTIVLHARAGTHHDRIGILIRSQDRSPPDARFVADRDVADQNSGGGNKSAWGDVRSFAFVLNNHYSIDLPERSVFQFKILCRHVRNRLADGQEAVAPGTEH